MVGAVTDTPGDPIAVLLARIEVKLDNALTEQARHSTTLERHDVRISKAENRLTALETGDSRDQANQVKTYSARSLAMAAIASCASGIGVAVAILQTKG